MKPLTLLAKIKAQKGKEIEAQKALEGLVPPTLKEEGCIAYNLHSSNENPGEFLFYEIWESEAHLQKHQANTHIQEFGKIADDLLDGEAELTKWTEI